MIFKGLKLTKEATASICETLRGNSSIQELQLCSLKATPESFTAIFEAINANKQLFLTSISMIDCEIEDKTITSLSRYILNMKDLETLNLKGCNIPKKSSVLLFQHIQKNSSIHGTLKHLNLSHNKIEGSQALQALSSMLKQLCALETLYLSNIGTCKTLEVIYLNIIEILISYY